MITVSRTVSEGAAIVSEIERRTGMRVADCYQCGRCTSTCIAAFAFDIPPHRLMHLLQLGDFEKVLVSATAQLCVDCMACSLRCPAQIDVALIIETAKNVADEKGLKDTEMPMRIFRREFLKNVRRHGRLHEPSLMTWINLKTGRPLNGLGLAGMIMRKKKIHFVPPRIKNLRHLRHLFRQLNGAVNIGGVSVPVEDQAPAGLTRLDTRAGEGSAEAAGITLPGEEHTAGPVPETP